MSDEIERLENAFRIVDGRCFELKAKLDIAIETIREIDTHNKIYLHDKDIHNITYSYLTQEDSGENITNTEVSNK